MSLLSLLSIARSALFVHQRAMSVTGHNVANASVPGYHRQRLDVHAAPALWTPTGMLGRGVDAGPVLRTRDTLLDSAYRRAAGDHGYSSTSYDVLSRVEAAFGEPSDHGVASAFDALFGAFRALAADPNGPATRMGVRDAATAFAARVRALDGELGALAQDTIARARGQVAEVNALARQVADLNARILAASGPLGGAPDLEDARDRALDQLATLVGGRVLERPDGSMSVLAGDTMLVDAGIAQQLEVRAGGGGFSIGRVGDAGTVRLDGGSLGALAALGTSIPARRTELDTFVRTVVTEVNAIHFNGCTPTGVLWQNFFDPAGVTAATIALAPGIAAGPDNIAAGSPGSPGDGAIAARIAALADGPLASLGGRTLRSLYADLATSVGSDVARAADDEAADAALANHADEQRASLFGVSVDEEMVALIAQQQAYAAAARLVRTADEMIQELLKVV